MPNNDRDPRDETDLMQMSRPRPDDFGALEVLAPEGNQMAPRQAINLFGTLMTAQVVPVKRNHKELMHKLAFLAATFGDKYLYGWEVKKKGGGTDWIEGGTVDLAYDLAREYGNNSTEVREVDNPSHITFYARFTDLETGYTTERSFRQRKSQTMGGKMDADRQLDIVYQIGQSKAIRNVTLKALSSYAEFVMEEAKASVYKKINADPEKYLGGIMRALEQYDIPLADVERNVGRKKAQWITRDIAGVFQKLKAVNDGMVTPAEAFPLDTPQVQSADKETSREGGAAADGEESSAKTSSGTGGRQAPKPEDTAAKTTKAAAKKAEPEAEQAQEEAKPAATAAKKAAKPKALFNED